MQAPSEALFLAQIVLLLLVGRLIGEAMQRIGQPAIIGQLIAGILLGPSVFGAIWPEAQRAVFPANPQQQIMIDAVSQLGILMLLLLTGMETDLRLVKKARRAAISTSVAGIIIPFGCGFALGELLPAAMLPKADQRIITSLFLGTALSIASVKIVAMVVREMGFMRRNVGITLIAAAIIDDTLGWIIVAIITGLAVHGQMDALGLGQSVLGTTIFLAVSFTLGRRLVFSIIRWTNDSFVSEMAVVTAILIIMGAMALTTDLIGINPVLGAFVAGILVGESPILTRHIDEQLRGLVTALFMPIFFSLAGLHANLTILGDSTLFLLTGGLILIASLGKFSGAFLGGALGGLSARESLALGCGMNARGSTEVIVASIGLSIGALSQDLFTMVVTMAVVTTTAMPPTLRWAFSRLPLGHDERIRLEREAFEATGFVTNIERLLIAVDDSANGKLARHLAGMLAGSRGIPMTVLHLGRHEVVQGIETKSERAEAVANGANETGAMSETGARRARARWLDVARHVESIAPEAAVTKEARRGYDFLMIGVERTEAAHGGFHEQIARIAAGFEGPLAIAVARGSHLQKPPERDLNILVPVRGNKASRRGAEVALALARAGTSAVTALYVMGTVGLGAAQRRLKRATLSRRHEETILKDIVELADRYDTPIHTALRLDIAPENAILRQARLGRYDLVVMGVGRPAGETLYFGEIAAAVLENSQHSILFVSS